MTKTGYIISQLSREFGISTRTIRFYEEKGLLSPERTDGNQRRYSGRDRFRLKWIIRGKRFGYSLDEIAKMLQMTELEQNETAQIKKTLIYGENKLKEIESGIFELNKMKSDLLELKEELIKRLHEIESNQTTDPVLPPIAGGTSSNQPDM